MSNPINKIENAAIVGAFLVGGYLIYQYVPNPAEIHKYVNDYSSNEQSSGSFGAVVGGIAGGATAITRTIIKNSDARRKPIEYNIIPLASLGAIAGGVVGGVVNIVVNFIEETGVLLDTGIAIVVGSLSGYTAIAGYQNPGIQGKIAAAGGIALSTLGQILPWQTSNLISDDIIPLQTGLPAPIIPPGGDVLSKSFAGPIKIWSNEVQGFIDGVIKRGRGRPRNL